MLRGECLDTAKNCVCGKREQDYGSPEDNFSVIADYWTTYLAAIFQRGQPRLYGADVAHMMALMKIGRITTGTATDDSYVDLAGYAACAAELQDRFEKEMQELKESDC